MVVQCMWKTKLTYDTKAHDRIGFKQYIGHDRVGFKMLKINFIETLKQWEAMQGNKDDIDAMVGHSCVDWQ